MADRVTVSWQGKKYEVVRKHGRDAEPEPAPVWQVTRDGAPITSFPAQDREGAAEVRGKVLEWLEANESRPPLDVGRQ
jgi:hypothetical protein